MNNPFLGGYERDTASGLDYANARMYHNGRGRFMQPDPMGLGAAALGRPGSLNRYSYVENDPINFTDRTGRLKESTVCHWIWYLERWECDDILEGDDDDGDPEFPIYEGGPPKYKLKKDDQKKYDEARKDAKDYSRDCKTFLGNALSKLGFTMDDLTKAIDKQQPLDALTSKINVVRAGIIPADYSNPKIPNATSLSVADFFAKAKEIGEEAAAATGFFAENTRYDVYFDPGSISSRRIIHEALHSLTRKNDGDLAAAFGRSGSEALRGSAWINDRLFKWGCGSD